MNALHGRVNGGQQCLAWRKVAGIAQSASGEDVATPKA